MWTDKLRNLDACSDAVRWASAYQTAQAAWDACVRPDWMIWLALKTGVSERVLWRAEVRMARLVEHLMTDERSRHALDMREAWLDGHATDDEMAAARAAADAAWVAVATAWDVVAATAETAARIAARVAACATWTATEAAWDAADAARAATGIATDVAQVAGSVLYRRCADVIRELIPVVPLDPGPRVE